MGFTISRRGQQECAISSPPFLSLVLGTGLVFCPGTCKSKPGHQRGVRKKNVLFFAPPEGTPDPTGIKIFKKRRILELYVNGRLTGRFRIALGRSPQGDKEREGDGRTPEGSYYICNRNTNSNFTLFLGLSYPGMKDAQHGLTRGLIGQEEYAAIEEAIGENASPPGIPRSAAWWASTAAAPAMIGHWGASPCPTRMS